MTASTLGPLCGRGSGVEAPQHRPDLPQAMREGAMWVSASAIQELHAPGTRGDLHCRACRGPGNLVFLTMRRAMWRMYTNNGLP